MYERFSSINFQAFVNRGGHALRSSASRKAKSRVIVLSLFVCSLLLLVPTLFLWSGARSKGRKRKRKRRTSKDAAGGRTYEVYSSEASSFRVTPALRDVKPDAAIGRKTVAKIQEDKR